MLVYSCINILGVEEEGAESSLDANGYFVYRLAKSADE